MISVSNTNITLLESLKDMIDLEGLEKFFWNLTSKDTKSHTEKKPFLVRI